MQVKDVHLHHLWLLLSHLRLLLLHHLWLLLKHLWLLLNLPQLGQAAGISTQFLAASAF